MGRDLVVHRGTESYSEGDMVNYFEGDTVNYSEEDTANYSGGKLTPLQVVGNQGSTRLGLVVDLKEEHMSFGAVVFRPLDGPI